MALNVTRLLLQRNLKIHNFRCLYTGSPLHVATSKPLQMSQAMTETHDQKNMRLKRPMSPHLTIYQVQLTALLSITHRATGMVLSGYAMVLGFGTLLLPGGIPCLIEATEQMGFSSPVLLIAKTLIALPATFHTFNGLRHLAWDMGLFLRIKEVYTTGYAVVALSIISAIVLGGL